MLPGTGVGIGNPETNISLPIIKFLKLGSDREEGIGSIEVEVQGVIGAAADGAAAEEAAKQFVDNQPTYDLQQHAERDR